MCMTRLTSWSSLRGLLLFLLCGPLAAAPYSGGDGTFTTPYLLSTATDLVTLAATTADWGKWFILTADVDMQATPVTTPIGAKGMPFTGVFDGGGYRIKGLVINDTTATTKPLGLFGVVDTPALIERLRSDRSFGAVRGPRQHRGAGGTDDQGRHGPAMQRRAGNRLGPTVRHRGRADRGQRRDRSGMLCHRHRGGAGSGRRPVGPKHGDGRELQRRSFRHDHQGGHRHGVRRARGCVRRRGLWGVLGQQSQRPRHAAGRTRWLCGPQLDLPQLCLQQDRPQGGGELGRRRAGPGVV